VPRKNLLWDFSVKTYGREGVASACLRLQDDHGADVNILMYCCWAAQDRALLFDAMAIERIISAVEPWKSSIVEVLRNIRRELKSKTYPGIDVEVQERLRVEIKRIELNAERLQQDALFTMSHQELLGGTKDRRGSALKNVLLYLNTLPSKIDISARSDAKLIVNATFEA
tara:strand:- start:121 stop:630 length:510 start_codon:yes stop_codon:yes gene_type:complete